MKLQNGITIRDIDTYHESLITLNRLVLSSSDFMEIEKLALAHISTFEIERAV